MQRKWWITILSIAALSAGLGLLIFLVISATSSDQCETAVVPYYITIRKEDGNILASWYEPYPNEECNAYYKLQYTIDSGKEEEVYVTGRSHALPVIQECSLMSIEVWAVTEAGKQTKYSISDTYREPPGSGGASDIKFSSLEEGLEITWTRPSTQENCDLLYHIKVTFDIISSETYTSEISTENITFSHDMYCFRLYFSIITYAYDKFINSSYVIYETDEVVKDIQVKQSDRNSNQMILTWTKHFIHEPCSLMYDVRKLELDGYEERVEVQDTTATLTAYFCAPFYIVITASTEYSSYSFTIAKLITLDPSQIDEITELNLSEDGSGQLVTWEAVPNLDHCNVTYNLDFFTDLDTVSFITNETLFEIPKEIYCFSLQFQVQAIVGEAAGHPIQSRIYIYDLEEPQELQLTPDIDENLLFLSWKRHDKPSQCNIEYKVLYEYADFYDIATVQESEIALDIAYCTDANVQVSAVTDSRESNSSTITHKKVDPISLGPVQNPTIMKDEKDNKAVISWNPPLYASQCVNFEYDVVGIEDNTKEILCTETSECSIDLATSCRYSKFIVQETSNITREAEIIYSCD